MIGDTLAWYSCMIPLSLFSVSHLCSDGFARLKSHFPVRHSVTYRQTLHEIYVITNNNHPPANPLRPTLRVSTPNTHHTTAWHKASHTWPPPAQTQQPARPAQTAVSSRATASVWHWQLWQLPRRRVFQLEAQSTVSAAEKGRAVGFR